jgi:hypothetical protein
MRRHRDNTSPSKMASSILSYVPLVGRLTGSQDGKVRAINLPSVEVHSIETDSSRRARSLKHLLRANHVNHSILYHHLQFDNHAPHILCSAYLLGASEEQLHDIYEKEDKQLEPWEDSPAEIVDDDWRDFLGDKRYQRAYVDFFEDKIANWNIGYYDWRKLVDKFIFSGDQPLAHGLIGGLGHPLIHLGYAFEMNSKDIAMESLALTATQYNFLHKFFDEPGFTKPSPFSSTSPRELLDRLSEDKRFNGVFDQPGFSNFEPLFQEHEHLVLEYWNAWTIEDDPVAQFRESQEAAVALLVETVSPDSAEYNFFVVHLLTTSHAVRILLPFVPAQFHVTLVREWWLLVVAIYICMLRPKINPEFVDPSKLEGKDWAHVVDKAINSRWATDAHFVKAIRAMKEASKTWGDDDQRYLASAVTFADKFDGWSF